MSLVDEQTGWHRAMRADARRNEARLLQAAGAAFAEHGAAASLEDIAERAGVGIGTLYRHYPTRRALAEAVFHDQIEALCAQARDLLDSPAPADALATWLRAVVRSGATKRGLVEFLKTTMDEEGSVLTWCRNAMNDAGSALLARAQDAGAVRPDVNIGDLLRLAHGIAWAADQGPDAGDLADRLLAITMAGLRPPEASTR